MRILFTLFIVLLASIAQAETRGIEVTYSYVNLDTDYVCVYRGDTSGLPQEGVSHPGQCDNGLNGDLVADDGKVIINGTVGETYIVRAIAYSRGTNAVVGWSNELSALVTANESSYPTYVNPEAVPALEPSEIDGFTVTSTTTTITTVTPNN